MKSLVILGTRPQYIKHAMFERACAGKIELINVHAEQQFEDYLSRSFMEQLQISDPKYKIISRATSPIKQLTVLMNGIEEILQKEKVENVILYGDTNTTMAGALAASRYQIPVAHIEAGLRSFNKNMPEEINRITIDHASKYLFCPGNTAVYNLEKEGLKQRVYNVGDVIKDLTLYAQKQNFIPPSRISDKYIFASLHRSYNVDDGFRLMIFLEAINKLSYKVLFSLHPRTRNAFETFNISREQFKNIVFLNPLSYFDTMSTIRYSEGVITDSGGLQKEAYWLKKKCATLRSETEWLETLNGNCNRLFWNDLSDLNEYFKTNDGIWDEKLYGDGNACEKIVQILIQHQ